MTEERRDEVLPITVVEEEKIPKSSERLSRQRKKRQEDKEMIERQILERRSREAHAQKLQAILTSINDTNLEIERLESCLKESKVRIINLQSEREATIKDEQERRLLVKLQDEERRQRELANETPRERKIRLQKEEEARQEEVENEKVLFEAIQARAQQDAVEEFLSRHCIREPKVEKGKKYTTSVRAHIAMTAFRAFLARYEIEFNSNKLPEKLEERGYVVKRHSYGMVYHGIQMREKK